MMMADDAVYWFGLAHLIAYAVIGTAVTIIWLVSEGLGRTLNRRRMLMAILNWKLAVNRWKRRSEYGLSDEEWARGEPQPHHFRHSPTPPNKEQGNAG
jgi:hypothetical protein